MSYSVPQDELISYPPSALYYFHVYSFEWIDNLHFILPPKKFTSNADRYVAIVKEKFLEAGWEGEGEIGILWLPPFIFPRALRIPPVGVLVWHVKQVEDGVSWLLSPIELPFEEFNVPAPDAS